YIGAKEYSKLKELHLGLENLVDFGFFASLGKLAFSTLQFFYKVTGNYGLAIIILTIIMQIILLPLSMKSFQSAKAMRVLQPKIRELQLKYKNDPKRLQTEIMYLYKSQKVNPLGGCLPMILQLPIFWALFTVLNNAYELKNAPFVLWIKDLSSPDLLFTIGTLPIRLLPLLMGVAMLVQQKFSGAAADPSQKTFTYLMPAMFTFIFWNFPSGLVLYWLTNSVLSIATQWIIMKQL
ncbi:MAG: membrane protein insertase YidC, partial [Elusimicrobiota bacterium]|nr:membrane protein insertase YidC [Elusimicrobiota bacterium]